MNKLIKASIADCLKSKEINQSYLFLINHNIFPKRNVLDHDLEFTMKFQKTYYFGFSDIN